MLSAASPSKQVTHKRSEGSPTSLTKNSYAKASCSFLKYSPSDQLPSISKKVVCRLSPTSSISIERKHFCELAKRFPAGCGAPSRYGTSGCIPEPVNRVVGSFSGTKGADR